MSLEDACRIIDDHHGYNSSLDAIVHTADEETAKILNSPNIEITSQSLKTSLENGNKYRLYALSENQLDAGLVLRFAGDAEISIDDSGHEVIEKVKHRLLRDIANIVTVGAFFPK